MVMGAAGIVFMAVIKAETDAGAAPGRAADGRSPFVRLAELLADVKPGKNPINLAVGEPQHPIPAFVGCRSPPRRSAGMCRATDSPRLLGLPRRKTYGSNGTGKSVNVTVWRS